MPRRLLHPILLALTLTALAACESKFNRHNFEMIRVGVDDQLDVREMLGKPDSDLGDVWMYDDFNHRRSAQILFGGDGRLEDDLASWAHHLHGQRQTLGRAGAVDDYVLVGA